MAMARFIIVFFFILAVSFIPMISSTEFIVGDDKGWTLGFDYQAWAQGKEFHVGDKLVFKYPEGKHNVMKVNGTGFQQCVASNGALTSGNDVIVLSSPGRKWYICGVGKHCEDGNMKLAITVQPQFGFGAPSPSPVPISSAIEKSSSLYSAFIVFFFYVFVMIMG